MSAKHFTIVNVILLLILSMFGGLTESVEASSSAQVETEKWTEYDRPAEYGVISKKNISIPMRDGVELIGNIFFPADEENNIAEGKFPVLLTQTPYNKLTGIGKESEYLVERGYVHIVVDVRGTGHSPGTWKGFSEVEQRDGYDLVEWAARQVWSDGNVGLYGSSYMAINQFFTAALQPPSLKAMFPVVPMGDAYRDIVMSGGQVNVAFIPLWLGLITGAGLIPSTNLPADPIGSILNLLTHTGAITDFQLNALTSALLGGDFAYDGAMMETMSPLSVVDKVEVPTFIAGGLNDIFQRGSPLLYEKLKQNNVTTKLLIGNWTHGDYGDDLPADGIPTLEQLNLRWFDHYLKGIDTKIDEIPDVTQYVIGNEKFEIQPGWPHERTKAEKLYLQPDKSLGKAKSTEDKPHKMIQQPLNGLCTGSTNQWLIGMVDFIPCMKDNRANEIQEVTYTTDVLEEDLHISGPIGAEMYVSTTQRDAVLSVRVTDVSPSGASKELTAGWLAASFRELDESKTRYLDGEIIQPWHPFTKESVQPVELREVMKLNVEIFPTNAVIKKGHKLRIAVGPSDFPHALSPVPQLLSSLGGVVSIHHTEEHPSHVVLPVVSNNKAPKKQAPPKKQPPPPEQPKENKDESVEITKEEKQDTTPVTNPAPKKNKDTKKQEAVQKKSNNDKKTRQKPTKQTQKAAKSKSTTKKTQPKETKKAQKVQKTKKAASAKSGKNTKKAASAKSGKNTKKAASAKSKKKTKKVASRSQLNQKQRAKKRPKESNTNRINNWWAAVSPGEKMTESELKKIASGERKITIAGMEQEQKDEEKTSKSNEALSAPEEGLTVHKAGDAKKVDELEINEQSKQKVDSNSKERTKSKTLPIAIAILSLLIPAGIFFRYFT